jgi:CubicO group peptidase (beta-lactamase class C family)
MLIEESLAGLPAAGIAVSVTAESVTATRCRGQIAERPVTPATVMYAASLAKQFVGYLTALAVEDGRLDYDGRIVHILPGLPAWLREARIGHLLHHTSGSPEVTESPSGPAADNRAVLDRLRAPRLPSPSRRAHGCLQQHRLHRAG